MSEDEKYRTSTQYRLWSYTPSALLSLRKTTNQNAAARVHAALQRVREARTNASSETSEVEQTSSSAFEVEVDCLTYEEELRLIAHYCWETLKLGEHLNLPTDVRATAVQYIKRFYITNSVMTYHPTDIMKTALFFATKTENHYFRLTKFADSMSKTKPEDILASEFLLTQGLRFTFDVRHPFRALEGAVMELQAMANESLPAYPGGPLVSDRPENMGRRVKDAHGRAREYLKSSALLTDVYFHYTPSQIMMASLRIADSSLTEWYLAAKLPSTSADSKTKDQVILLVDQCAKMLKERAPSEPSADEKKQLSALSKKLKKCRNPEKLDLVGLQRAKREGEDLSDQKVAKKRKLEKQANGKSTDDLFGPDIRKA